MKISIREKRIYLSLFFLTLAAILCIIGIKGDIFLPASQTEKIYIPDLIIDAGHGGLDGGAVSSNGVSEAAINLSISKKAEFIAEFLGIKTMMTRENENSLMQNASDTIKQNKRNDLKARVDIAKNNPESEFISIHLNKFSDCRYFGAQVFHKNDPSSILLAQNVQGALYEIDERNKRSHKNIPNENYIFERIPNTGIIVECGFLSNAEEEMLLQNDDYQTKLAMLIVGGYSNYKYNR